MMIVFLQNPDRGRMVNRTIEQAPHKPPVVRRYIVVLSKSTERIHFPLFARVALTRAHASDLALH